VGGVALDRPAIEPPRGVAEHRHHESEAEEEGQRADDKRRRDDEAPERDRAGILAREPHRGDDRRNKADVAVEHQRKGDDADAERQRCEAKSNEPAQDNEEPASAARQHVLEERERGRRRIGAVKLDI